MTHRNNTYYNLTKYLEITNKAIPIAIFITSIVGGFQLISFSKFHAIHAIDFLTSGVTLAFGAAYLVYYALFFILFNLMILGYASQNKFLYSSIIDKSRFENIQIHHLLSRLIFSTILSIWPLALLSKNHSIEIFFSILFLTSLILLIYHNFCTTDTSGEPLCSLSRFKTIVPALLPVLSAVVITLSIESASEFIKYICGELSDVLFVLAIITFSTIINFLSFTKPSKNKEFDYPFAMYITPFIFSMIFIFPNTASKYTPNTIIHALGIGLQKRCYISSSIEDSHIPGELKRTYGPITELNVTINIGDIYYLSRFGDPEMISVFRFTSHDYKQIACQKKRENMDTHYL